MTLRRLGDLIELAPLPPDERLVLRLYRRPNHPDVFGADDVLAWWWTSPIVCEGLAPMPPRIFSGMPRILAESALADPASVGRS